MGFVNVVIRLLVVITGILIITGIPPFDAVDTPLREIFGAVVVLFGIYRLLIYSFVVRRNRQ